MSYHNQLWRRSVTARIITIIAAIIATARIARAAATIIVSASSRTIASIFTVVHAVDFTFIDHNY
jgi:hypothetical protein